MKYFICSFALLALIFNTALAANDKSPRHIEYPTYYANVNNIRIAYQEFGKTSDPAILLVMGLGGQLIHWEDDFVFSLVDKGYRVIRYDNRDAGWSEKMYKLGTPGAFTLLRYKLGLPLKAPYRLSDMAADGIGLLDHLEISNAHVVGISMGGMIAQIMAGKHPDRVMSLTSIMSTSGSGDLPSSKIKPALSDQDQMTREQVIADRAKFAQMIDGVSGEPSAQEWHDRMARSYDRSNYSDGLARQLWAIVDSGDRVELLKSVKQPTLVIHGNADPLIPYQAGEHTAELVPNAKFVLLDGVGHFINKESETLIVNEIVGLVAQLDDQLALTH